MWVDRLFMRGGSLFVGGWFRSVGGVVGEGGGRMVGLDWGSIRWMRRGKVRRVGIGRGG